MTDFSSGNKKYFQFCLAKSAPKSWERFACCSLDFIKKGATHHPFLWFTRKNKEIETTSTITSKQISYNFSRISRSSKSDSHKQSRTIPVTASAQITPTPPGTDPATPADGASLPALGGMQRAKSIGYSIAEGDLPAAGEVLAYLPPASSVDALPLPMSQIVTPIAHVGTYLGKRPRKQKFFQFSRPETITIVFDSDQPPSCCQSHSTLIYQGAPHFSQTRSILKKNDVETQTYSSSTASDDDDNDIGTSFEDLDSLNGPDPLAFGHDSDALLLPDWLE